MLPTPEKAFSVTGDSGMCPVCVLRGSFDQGSLSTDLVIFAASDSEGASAKTEPLSIVHRFEHYEVMLDCEEGKPMS